MVSRTVGTALGGEGRDFIASLRAGPHREEQNPRTQSHCQRLLAPTFRYGTWRLKASPFKLGSRKCFQTKTASNKINCCSSRYPMNIRIFWLPGILISKDRPFQWEIPRPNLYILTPPPRLHGCMRERQGRIRASVLDKKLPMNACPRVEIHADFP